MILVDTSVIADIFTRDPDASPFAHSRSPACENIFSFCAADHTLKRFHGGIGLRLQALLCHGKCNAAQIRSRNFQRGRDFAWVTAAENSRRKGGTRRWSATNVGSGKTPPPSGLIPEATRKRTATPRLQPCRKGRNRPAWQATLILLARLCQSESPDPM